MNPYDNPQRLAYWPPQAQGIYYPPPQAQPQVQMTYPMPIQQTHQHQQPLFYPASRHAPYSEIIPMATPPIPSPYGPSSRYNSFSQPQHYSENDSPATSTSRRVSVESMIHSDQCQYQFQYHFHQPHHSKADIENVVLPPLWRTSSESQSSPMPDERGSKRFHQDVVVRIPSNPLALPYFRSNAASAATALVASSPSSHHLPVSASPATDCGESSQDTKTRTRHMWTADEDAMLIYLVNKHGAKNWGQLASFIPGRTADNVRLRYMYVLQYSEDMRERPFSEAEDAMILKEAEGERHWRKIGKEMGRSCGAVRNRYDLLRRQTIRKEKKAAQRKETQEQIAMKLSMIKALEMKQMGI